MALSRRSTVLTLALSVALLGCQPSLMKFSTQTSLRNDVHNINVLERTFPTSAPSAPTPLSAVRSTPPSGMPANITTNAPINYAERNPAPTFDDAPDYGKEALPGCISIIYRNDVKVRIASTPELISAEDKKADVGIRSILSKYHIRKAIDQSVPGKTTSELDSLTQHATGVAGKEIPHPQSIHTYYFDGSTDTAQVAKELRSLPFVRTAYRAGVVKGSSSLISGTYTNTYASPPSDPFFFSWSSDPGIQRDWWWWYNRHRVVQSWSIFGNRPMPSVTVIDSGFDTNGFNVGDFYEIPNYLVGSGASFANGQKSAITTLVEPSPDANNYGFSHGASVAAIIGAPKNNGVGNCGVAPGAGIVPYRVALDNPSLAAAIRYAADYSPSKVINISMGLGGSAGLPLTYDPVLRDAIRYASYDRSKVVVISAGNKYTALNNFPTIQKVGEIMVGGTQLDGKEWYYGGNLGTNFGNVVDMAAAADAVKVPVWKPVTGERVMGHLSGTSLSAPMVAATAAMMAAFGAPEFQSPQVIRSALIHSGTIGMSALSFVKLGEWLNTSDNFQQLAGIRDLNMENALALAATSGSKSIVVRTNNSDDRTFGTKDWQWFYPFHFNSIWGGLKYDAIYDLSTDGYQAGNGITFYTGNDGNYWSTGAQVYWHGLLVWEHIRGVVAHDAPWGNLYQTVPATPSDNGSGWVYPYLYTVINPN